MKKLFMTVQIPSISVEQVLAMLPKQTELLFATSVEMLPIPGGRDVIFYCSCDEDAPVYAVASVDMRDPMQSPRAVLGDLLDRIYAQGVVVGVAVRHPRADRYEVPEVATTERHAIETLATANGFAVPEDKRFESGVRITDSGDDTPQDQWFTVRVPHALANEIDALQVTPEN